MNALSVIIAIVCLTVLLYVVGVDRIRDVLEDFVARSEGEAHMTVDDELERLWALPAREPRKLA